MTYAFLTDGLEPESKDKIDAMLEGTESKAKIRREREAAEAAMRFPR